MTAIDKTKSLVRQDIPIGQLVKNEANPNRMGQRDFDLLVDNLEQTGITDPILVRPLKVKKGEPPRYRIVGGHHRFDAAAFLGFETVPCTVITDPGFDDDAERFQMVRMNVIRGRIDAQAFFDLYQQLADVYSDEVLQDAFGFAEEAEFRKLIDQVAKQLPDPGLQKQFKQAAKEIKTIDGLSKLLNEMFAKYGDTLPYGFMVFDHAGQRSVWLQVEDPTLKAFDVLGKLCIERRRTVDDLIGRVLQRMAKGELQALLEQVIAETPEVELPAGLQALPTKETIQMVAAIP
jgi:hypothetical protein